MKKIFNQIKLSVFPVFKINKSHLEFILMLVALALLVLGAGAPEQVGGVGR